MEADALGRRDSPSLSRIRALASFASLPQPSRSPPRQRSRPSATPCNDRPRSASSAHLHQQRLHRACRSGKRIIPFYFHQPGDSGYRHIMPVLYFHTWGNTTTRACRCPLFVMHRDYNDRSNDHVIPPCSSVVQARRPRRSEFRLWPFVFMANYKPSGGQAAILPLFWWKKLESRACSSRRFCSRADCATTTKTSPRWSSRSSATTAASATTAGACSSRCSSIARRADSRWTLVARSCGSSARDEGRDAGVIFPLFWHFADTEEGYEPHVAPAALRLRVAAARRKQRAHLAARRLRARRRDRPAPVARLRAAHLLSQRRQRTVDVVPPLVHALEGARTTAPAASSSGRSFTPAIPAARRRALFPLFWRFHDKQRDATTTSLLADRRLSHRGGAAGGFVGPVYWLVVDERRRRLGRGPGADPHVRPLGHRAPRAWCCRCSPTSPTSNRSPPPRSARCSSTHAPDGCDGGLVPARVRRPPRRRQLRRSCRPSSSTRETAGPPTSSARSTSRAATRGWAAGLAPLVFFGTRRQSSHQVIFPLFCHFADKAKQTSASLIGPFYHGRDGDRSSRRALPALLRAPRTEARLRHLAPRRLEEGRRRDDGGRPLRPPVERAQAVEHQPVLPALTHARRRATRSRCSSPSSGASTTATRPTPPSSPSTGASARRDHGWDGVFPLFVHA